MISPRQKLRLDSEVPVLFRLPNLRAQGAHASAGLPPEVAAPPADLALRIDPPAPAAIPEMKPAAPEMNQAVPVTAQSTSAVEPLPATNATPHQVPRPASQSRSWMERVGSRLILVVTLMVIVTAAWITGRRMPASKPDPWNDSPSIEHEVAVTGKAEPAQTAPSRSSASESAHSRSEPTASAVADTTVGLDTFAAIEPPSAQSSAWTHETHVHLPSVPLAAKPADVQSPTKDISPQVASGAPSPSTSFAPATPPESLPVFNTVSMQSPASNTESTAASTSAESLSLDPPLPANPAVDSTSSKDSVGETAPGVQTSTPHAPVVDPEVLLPWFHEQVAARNYRKSTTPNAIADWSRYLPSATNGDAQVRAVSSNEPTGAPVRAQQAIVPHGIVTNPYSQ